MTFGIIAIIVIATLACVASRPTSSRATARGLKRRVRLVRRNPARATSCDVELILNDEVSETVTGEICRLAEERDVSSEMLWSWADSHSPTALALALGAGYDRRELALTAPAESEIDEESLLMHAELNGSLVGAMLAESERKAA